MKRFWFNLLWYLGVVLVAELLPIALFFRLHLVWGVDSLVPQMITSLIFLLLLVVQAIFHYRYLKRHYPRPENKNLISTLGLTVLLYFTMWAIIGVLILWAMATE